MMGMQRAQVPEAKEYGDFMRSVIGEERPNMTFMATLDGQTIGHIVLREIRNGHDCELHYHMHARKRAISTLGSVWSNTRDVFYAAARFAMQRYSLQYLRCEPPLHNPMPNRFLQQLGFQIADTIQRTSGLSAGMMANRYIITRADVGLDWG